jgi:hypothetical protein
MQVEMVNTLVTKDKITIMLDRELLQSLRKEAKASGVSVSGLIESELVCSIGSEKLVEGMRVHNLVMNDNKYHRPAFSRRHLARCEICGMWHHLHDTSIGQICGHCLTCLRKKKLKRYIEKIWD